MTCSAERSGAWLAGLVLVLALSSCATLDRSGPDEVVYELAYAFYTLDPRSFRMRPLDAPAPDSRLVLVFPTIPGVITGPPSGGPLRTVPVPADATFRLRLPARLEARAERLAADSLDIDPRDTRVARLGTFHEYPEYGVFRGGGGFINARTGEPLMLVYFSSAARLQGSVDRASGAHDYDVTVERAGWSWLVVRAGADGGSTVREYTGPLSAVEFAVLLPPMMIPGAKQ